MAAVIKAKAPPELWNTLSRCCHYYFVRLRSYTYSPPSPSFSLCLVPYLSLLFTFSALYLSLFAVFFSRTLSLSHTQTHIHTRTLALFVVFSFISFFYLFRQWPAFGPSKKEGDGWLFLQKKSVVERLRKEGESLFIRYLLSTQKTYLRQGSDVLELFNSISDGRHLLILCSIL